MNYFGLSLGKASLEKVAGEFFVFVGFDFLLACHNLHSNKTDARFMARLNGVLHFGILHLPEIVACHYCVYPVELGRSSKTAGHI